MPDNVTGLPPISRQFTPIYAAMYILLPENTAEEHTNLLHSPDILLYPIDLC